MGMKGIAVIKTPSHVNPMLAPWEMFSSWYITVWWVSGLSSALADTVGVSYKVSSPLRSRCGLCGAEVNPSIHVSCGSLLIYCCTVSEWAQNCPSWLSVGVGYKVSSLGINPYIPIVGCEVQKLTLPFWEMLSSFCWLIYCCMVIGCAQNCPSWFCGCRLQGLFIGINPYVPVVGCEVQKLTLPFLTEYDVIFDSWPGMDKYLPFCNCSKK